MNVAESLRAIMAITSWSQERLAEELSTPGDQVSQPRVNGWITKGQVPRGDRVLRIKALLDRVSSSGERLEDNVEDIEAATKAMLEGLQVAGVVEAGTFRAVDLLDQEEPSRIPITKDARYPHLAQYAWKVRGDSADRAKILDGMYAIGALYADWVEYYGEAPADRFVIVQKSRADGAEIELTIKEARFFSDRLELHPRSSNSKHQPIIIPRTENPEDFGEVRIIAVVLNAVTVF